MKAVPFFLAAAFSMTVLPAKVFAADAKTPDSIKVNPYGKYLEQKGDLTAEIAMVEGKNADGMQDVLMKIQGAAAATEGIDGKVMYYRAEPAGNGYNLVYDKGPKDKAHVRMVSRDSWGTWKNVEMYVGGETFHLYPNADKAKTVQSAQLLNDYKQSQTK